MKKTSPVNVPKRHDEERRKRDIISLKSLSQSNLVNVEDINKKMNLKHDVGEVAYDTRHLLWISRRRKRRGQRNQDYWDET